MIQTFGTTGKYKYNIVNKDKTNDDHSIDQQELSTETNVISQLKIDLHL